MTRVKVTYLAMDEENIPLVSAATFEDLRKGLDEYFGIGKDKSAKHMGWFPYETKYGGEYEGHHEYFWMFGDEPMNEKVRVFCIDFYPHTVYEVK